MANVFRWEMKDLRAFVDLVADDEAKKIMDSKPAFKDLSKANYVIGFIGGLQVLQEMYANNKIIELSKAKNIAEVIDLVKEFKQSQRPGVGGEMH